MKVLAIIGSLRKKNTFDAVQKFEAAHKKRTEDIEYEYLFIKDLDFKQCKGCFLCISQGEAKCPLKDDRDLIIQKIESADCVIFAGPNYSMNVNWLTKNLIDRFAYNLHRPMYFEQRFVMLITSGSYMGTKQALKALSLLASGGRIIGRIVLHTAPELSDKTLLKQDIKFQKKANRIFKLLERDRNQRPPFSYLFWFASFRALHDKNKKSLPADYEFYKDKEYFTDTKLSAVQKIIIKSFTRFFKSILN